MPILSSSNTFFTIRATQPNIHAFAPMTIFISRLMWPFSNRWIHIYCHWCLFQVPRSCIPKGHFFKKFDKGIRVDIFQTWLPNDTRNYLWKLLMFEGIYHAKSATHWPRSNREIECYIRTLLKSICLIHAEGKDRQSYFNLMLLHYCSTKHATTQATPAMLLFYRDIRNHFETKLQTYHIKRKQNETTPPPK